MICFNNDYSEGAHPAILQALAEENLRQNPGYGMDSHCAAAAAKIRELAQCPQADVHFLVGGTPCNLISLTAFLRPHQAAIAADTGILPSTSPAASKRPGTRSAPLPRRRAN